MTLRSTRSVSLRVFALALVSCPALLLAQGLAQADHSDTQSFTVGPDYPSGPVPAEAAPTQNLTPALPPVPMPPDRAADSYRIYSVLLPVGELSRPDFPRNLWLLSDTTLALVPPDQSCLSQDADSANPHVAIQAPADRQQDFAELLDDFDRRCHERIHLTADAFNLVVPLRLINQDEEDQFIRDRFDPNGGPDADALTAHYHGAPGLSRFSQVYFNSHHTLAMVFANGWCGGLCAHSYWEILELNNGAWKRLAWHTTDIMS